MNIGDLKRLRLTHMQIAKLLGIAQMKLNEMEKQGLLPQRDAKGRSELAETLTAYVKAKPTNHIDMKKIRVNGAELARAIGISAERVRYYEEKGVFNRDMDNLFTLSECIFNYVGRLKARKKKNSPGEMFEGARAKKMVASAQIEELELKRKQGELVPIQDVVDIVKAEYAIVRQRLFSIPNKIAFDIFACETPQEAQEIINKHLNEALDELKYDTGRTTSESEGDDSQTGPNDNASGVGGQVQNAIEGSVGGTGEVADI